MLSILKVRNLKLKLINVNLHQSRIVSAELLVNLEKGGFDVA